MLVKFVHPRKTAWGSFLDTCVFAYNTSRHESTRFTPFELMFNRQATLPIDIEFRKALPEEVSREYHNLEEPDMAKLEEERARRLDEAKQNILEAQQKQKETYDRKHAKPECYKIGQLVLKKDFTRKKRKGGKLEIRFLGPYTISKVLPHGTYELLNPTEQNTIRVTGTHLKLYNPPNPSSPPEADLSPPPSPALTTSPSESGLNDSIESIPPLPPPMPSLAELQMQLSSVTNPFLPQPPQTSVTNTSPPQPPQTSVTTKKRRNTAAYSRDAKRRRQRTESSRNEPYDVDTHVSQQPPLHFWKEEYRLTDDDRQILSDAERWLNDKLIDAGQKMLLKQYGDRVSGLQDVIKSRTLSMDIEPSEFVQILNKSDSHWFTVSTIGCKPGVVNVYDSATKYTTHRNKEEIAALLHTTSDTITLQYMNVQHQYGGSDCGLFALAFATALCAGINPTACTFKQELMRNHFLSCINKGQIEQFPIKQSRRAITRPVKIDTIDIHCHCRMPENPQDRMILCNGSCKQWYHDTCEHIEDHIWNSKLRWYCRHCKK